MNVDKKKQKKKYGVFSNIVFLARDMAKTYPLLIVFLIMEMVLRIVSPFLSLYIPKLSLDLVTKGASPERAVLLLGGMGLLMAVMMALSSMAARGKYAMYNTMRTVYHKRIFLQSLGCDYSYVESAEGRRTYLRAKESISPGDASGTSRMVVSAVEIFVSVISFALYSTVISTLNFWVVAAVAALSLINLFAVKMAQKYERKNRDAAAKLSNQMGYVEGVSNDFRWGKDIRLYDMKGWLISVRNKLLESYERLAGKIQQRYFAAGTVSAAVLLLRDAFAYGYLIMEVSSGNIGPGDFVLYFGAVTGISGFVSSIVDHVNDINGANMQMNDLRAFLDNSDTPEPEDLVRVPRDSKVSLEFRNVTFSYTSDGEPVLKNFNMKINAGEKIALVGVNGAGKTTVVKLLCGLYRPDSGEILIDGKEIGEYRREELFTLFSTVFQDVFIPPLTVAENISMRSLENTDMERVDGCLKQIGLYDVIERYPQKARSFMHNEVEAGVELSGGQQQKLLMARALYKDAPVLILDEPTAALDPIAESETYESFHELSLDKTSVYISHRLASTRFCDRIYLLSGGTVKEVGTHDELLSLKGEYAQMYEMQSHYYKEKGGERDA